MKWIQNIVKNFFKYFIVGILIILTALCIHLIVGLIFNRGSEITWQIFETTYAVTIYYLLLLIIIKSYAFRRSKIKYRDHIYNFSMGTHVGLILGAYIFISSLGLILSLNPSLISPYVNNRVTKPDQINEILIVIFSAGIGSSVASLLAYLKHFSVLKDFDPAYTIWYYTRPVMGMMLGIIFYVTLKGGFLRVTTDTSESLDIYALAAMGALVGMFSKDALVKLKEVFNVFFQRTEDQELTTHSMVVSSSIIQEFYKKNKNLLMEKYQPLGLGLGKKQISGLQQNVDCISFMVAEKSNNPKIQIPSYFPYIANDGKKYNIPTDIVQETDISASSKVCPGSGIAVGDSPGTLGLIVESQINGVKETCLLSCFHVLCGKDFSDSYREFDKNSATDTSVMYGGKKIATVVKGKINSDIDGALAIVEPTIPFDTESNHPYIKAPKIGIKILNKDDVNNNTILYISGSKTKARGSVRMHTSSAKIKFGHHVVKFDDLIVTDKLSVKGDSGAPLFTDKGEVVGLLVGDSDTKSFIQPILPLITQLNFMIKYLA